MGKRGCTTDAKLGYILEWCKLSTTGTSAARAVLYGRVTDLYEYRGERGEVGADRHFCDSCLEG